MAELYLPLRWTHILTVLMSGLLFGARGLLVAFGRKNLAMAAPARYLSYGIDTVLLTAAVLLTVIVGQYPVVDDWLTTKVLLLLVYIVLGSIALKRGRDRRTRIRAYVAAMLVYGFMVGVARAHHPLSWFALL
jgi:uncharacterized membrane protein SirB2